MEWREVAPERAERHPHFGLGGWLLFFYVLAVLGFASTFFSFLNLAALKQFYGDRFALILGAQVAQALLYLPFIVLAPMRHPMMPRATVIAMWSSVAISFLVAAIIGLPTLWLTALFTTGVVGLFNWYLNRSRRVNVTYRHRVRADEPEPAETPAA